MEPINIRLAVICSLAAAVFLTCTNGNQSRQVMIKETRSVFATGVVKAKNQYEAFSKVSGIIQNINVSVNDIIKKDMPVMKIADEKIALNPNNPELVAAFMNIYSNKEKIRELKNYILLAQTTYKIDSLNYARQLDLWQKNIGTKYELEMKELACLNAKKAMESAFNTYSDVLNALRLNTEPSENDADDSPSGNMEFTIRSKIDGKVYSILKVKGEMINPQMPLAVIGGESFFVELQVDINDIGKVKAGQKLMIYIDNHAGQAFEGAITSIDPVMNEHTMSYTITADFSIQPELLHPFLKADANIVVE